MFIAVLTLLASLRAEAIPFYEVRFHGHVSYVFGTIHKSLPPDLLPNKVRDKLESARILYLEADPYAIADAAELAVQADIAAGQRRGRNTKAIFSMPEWMKIKRVLAAVEADPDKFRFLSPKWAWMMLTMGFDYILSNTINDRTSEILMREPTLALQMAEVQAERLKGKILDLQLRDIATGAGIATKYLDLDPSVEPNLFPELNGMTTADLKIYFRARLAQMKANENIPEAEIRAYIPVIAGLTLLTEYLPWTPDDSMLITDIPGVSTADLPELEPIWEPVINRQRQWFPKILAEVKTGNAFIAVGVNHVIREGNNMPSLDKTVLEMLEKEGAQIRFIGNPDCPDRLLH